MQTAEKKLNCLKGTGRANKPCIGYIEGSVNDASMPKGGKKQVSIIDKKVTFWAVNDFDVTVFPEDIVGCQVVAIGVNMKHKVVTTEKNESGANKKADQYGDVLELTFANGTSGRLEVTDFCAFSDEAIIRPDLNPLIKSPKEDDWKYWNSCLESEQYYPVVAGWISENGVDEHYNDMIPPYGYTADIVKLVRKAQASNKINAVADIAKAVTLRNKITDLTEALDLHTRFEGFDTAYGDNNHTFSIIKGQNIKINDKYRRYIRLEK